MAQLVQLSRARGGKKKKVDIRTGMMHRLTENVSCPLAALGNFAFSHKLAYFCGRGFDGIHCGLATKWSSNSL